MNDDNCFVVVPWVYQWERDAFLHEWNLNDIPDRFVLQHDKHREGCGVTKNKGIIRAIEMGAETIIVLDGDCYPNDETETLQGFVEQHCAALEPQEVNLFEVVTDPPSRGTPYAEHSVMLPVAASMGFWTEVGDYCAVRQLAFNSSPMEHKRETVFQRYFPMCGMNLAFKPQEWLPWCQFIDVPRFDDIWMGWMWQREAYQRGYCFNLNGPMVRHSRQSNVWQNLRDEGRHLERNEMLWREIALHPLGDYESLRQLLPV